MSEEYLGWKLEDALRELSAAGAAPQVILLKPPRGEVSPGETRVVRQSADASTLWVARFAHGCCDG